MLWKDKNINLAVLNELYNFIINYYNDIRIADYVMDLFSIEKINFIKSDVSYDKFFRILHHLHRMSGDQLICYNAGRFFSQNKLMKGLTPGIRFSVKKTFDNIDKILVKYFPALQASIKSRNNGSLFLSINSLDSSIRPDFFFTEYLKGLISAIPNHWDLPSADVKIDAYIFSIEELLEDIDIPYKKKDSLYYVYDNKIAEEIQINNDSRNGNSGQYTQIIKEDLYIQNIFIKSNVKLCSISLELRIKWKNSNYLRIYIFAFLSIVAAPFFVILLNHRVFSPQFLTAIFLLYEMLVFFVYSIFRNRDLKKIYNRVESELLNELAEQKTATGEAVSSAINRLQSIENVMEITKQIIHEKNIVILFDNIRKLTAKALNADRTTVFIHDREKRELRSGPSLSEEKQEFRIPEDKGIVGEVFKLRKIVNVKDAYNNPHFNKAIDRQTGYETRTILGAPLLDLEDNFIGIIQVLNKKGGEFQEIDEHILESLSTYIASALKDSLTIRNLQQRGLDPDLISGLNLITKFVFNEYVSIQSSIAEIEDPAVDIINNRMNNLSLLLEKLTFLFDESYTVKDTPGVARDIFNTCRLFIMKNKGGKRIVYIDQMSIAPGLKLLMDMELLDKIISEILINSIESIDIEGEIKVWMHYFVVVPNDIANVLFIQGIITEYNAFSEENYSGFIKFITSRRPLLESDLDKIKGSMREYIAIEFFDNGTPIGSDIKDKIFHPFFSTKNRFGLGLAIAKTAISRMGGMIDNPTPCEGGKSIRLLVPLKRISESKGG